MLKPIFRPWLRFPGQSLFHWFSLVVALALLALVMQILLRGKFHIPPGITVVPGYYTIGMRDPRGAMTPMALLQAQMLENTISGLGAHSLYVEQEFAVGIGHLPQKPRLLAVMAHGFYQTIGLKPVVGRLFSKTPEQANQEVLISYALWQVLGAPLHLSDLTVQLNTRREWHVVGVLPKGFTGFGLSPVDIWLPDTLLGEEFLWLDLDSNLLPALKDVTLRFKKRNGLFYILGRHASTEDYSALRQQLQSLDLHLPPFMTNTGPVITTGLMENDSALLAAGLTLTPSSREKIIRYTHLLQLLAIDLLLLVAIGVLLFLLEQLPERLGEFRIRHILGANMIQLAQQIFSENLLFFLGTVPAAWGLSYLGFGILAKTSPFSDYIPDRLSPPDFQLFLWTAGAAVTLAAILSLVPLLLLRKALSPGTSATTRSQGAYFFGLMLNSLQITTAVISLVLAFLFGANLYQLNRYQQLPMNDIHLLSWKCTTGVHDCFAGLDKARLEDAMRPGSRHLGLGQQLFGLELSLLTIQVEPVLKTASHSGTLNVREAQMRLGWLQAMNVNLAAGRWPQLANEVLVNQAFLRQQGLSAQEIIGRQYRRNGSSDLVHTVTGVVSDLAMEDPRKLPSPRFIFTQASPYLSGTINELAWAGDAEPALLVNRFTQALNAQGVAGFIVSHETLAQRVRRLLRGERHFAGLVGVTGIYTLLLSLVGLYAAARYVLRKEQKGLGVRLAYGALPYQLIADVSSRVFSLLGAAVALGFFILGLIQPVINPWLLSLRGWIPWGLSLVCLLVLTGATAALLLALRKLWKTEPIALLRDV